MKTFKEFIAEGQIGTYAAVKPNDKTLSYDIGNYNHKQLNHEDIPPLHLTHEYQEDLDIKGK